MMIFINIEVKSTEYQTKINLQTNRFNSHLGVGSENSLLIFTALLKAILVSKLPDLHWAS